VLARQGRTWVSVVPAAANDILAEALRTGEAAGLRDARVVGREVRHGRSRFDFVLSWRGRRVWTEVKSAGLVVRGLALFPDAPSARAVRHLGELLDLARRGQPALLVFVVQRGDARAVAPFAERDPEFARALAEARRGGVALRAYACQVGPRGLRLDRPLPLRLSPGGQGMIPDRAGQS
jgi:sugar fermentation stimulation protein A